MDNLRLIVGSKGQEHHSCPKTENTMNMRIDTDTLLPPLYEHQREALSSIVVGLCNHDRGKVIMACGSGKTRLGPETADAVGARTVIALFPSLALIRQTLDDWKAHAIATSCPSSWICICSDDSVAGDSDETQVSYEELKIPVTTDSSVLREFLLAESSIRLVVFATYQSGRTVAAAIPDGFAFDLGIFDEAHKTTGHESPFAEGLHDHFIPIAKRVFFTATPKHISHRQKSGEGKIVYSMDDESCYGPTLYQLSMREAIHRGIISDYRVIISVVDHDMLSRSSVTTGAVLDGNARSDAESVANAIAIQSAMQQYGCKKVITFHDYVNSAHKFATAELVTRELDMPIWHVNGKMSTQERADSMGRFAQSRKGLVTNARCLTEGVDVPTVDMVAFLCPKRSEVDIVQAIGRALRNARGKRLGYILIPLYVETVNPESIEKLLSESGYDRIWSVIEALREQDEFVAQSLSNATVARTAGESRESGIGNIEVNGPLVQIEWLRKAIDIRCIAALGNYHDNIVGYIKRYIAEHGHADVPQSHVMDGMRLGAICSQIRQRYRGGELSADLIAQFEAIGFRWTPRDSDRERNLSLIERYAAEHGHANVPKSHVMDGTRLGDFCIKIRQQYRGGELSADLIARLDAIGFRWSPMDDDRERNLSLIERYAAEHGHADVPQSCVMDGTKLGKFCIRIRTRYRKGELSADLIARLEAIGFRWSPMDDDRERNLSLIERYVAEHGHANVPQSCVMDGTRLGNFCIKIRQQYRGRKLSADLIARLDAIGFRWSPMDDDRERNLSLIEHYVAEHGHADVPQSCVMDGTRLGDFCIRIRMRYRKGELSADLIARLEAIGFRWIIRPAKQ